MGKKQKKPGQGKEKTERKTAKATEKRARRDELKVSEEDDIDAILVIPVISSANVSLSRSYGKIEILSCHSLDVTSCKRIKEAKMEVGANWKSQKLATLILFW